MVYTQQQQQFIEITQKHDEMVRRATDDRSMFFKAMESHTNTLKSIQHTLQGFNTEKIEQRQQDVEDQMCLLTTELHEVKAALALAQQQQLQPSTPPSDKKRKQPPTTHTMRNKKRMGMCDDGG